MTISNLDPQRALKTKDAADYLGVSVSMLQKLRLRGQDDPGVAGPAFIRLSATCVVYRVGDLNAWLASRQGTLLTRGAA